MWISKEVQCPYCWESIEILIDPGETEQDYIEDCSVCCRPIHFKVWIEEGQTVYIEALDENEI